MQIKNHQIVESSLANWGFKKTINTILPIKDVFVRKITFNGDVNMFASLQGLEQDIDIYISKKIKKDGIIFYKPLVNSTNFGINNESLFFSPLPESGPYFIELRFRNVETPQTLEGIAGSLIIDTKTFDENTKIPNDPLMRKQWYLFNSGSIEYNDYLGILPNADIRAPEAWNINYSAHDVIVAVVDEGVEISHPDLAGNIYINKGEIPGNNRDDDNNGFIDDVNGWNFGQAGHIDDTNDPSPSNPEVIHGTHVAGTIGAAGDNAIGISGVAWNVQILPVSVEVPGKNYLGDTTSGLKYAADNGADIVNMSFGTILKYKPAELMLYMNSDGSLTHDFPFKDLEPTFRQMHKTYNLLKMSDVLMVVAAGNNGTISASVGTHWQNVGNNDETFSTYPFYSYFYDNSMVVAASDAMMHLTPFTSVGLTVDISAPGGHVDKTTNEFGILSTVPLGYVEKTGGEHGSFIHQGADYGYLQGTSMSAPVVSGAAALVKSINSNLKAAEIRNILMKSANENPRLEGLAGERGLQLNLEKALQLASEWSGERSLFDNIIGTNQNDQLRSSTNDSWLEGRKGKDLITGNTGNDKLFGNKGHDTLIPGKGFDYISGGRGRDTVVYNHKDESPIARPDQILFNANDRFDLSALDGDPDQIGVQELKLQEQDYFSGQAGELIARNNGIFVDLDGDKYADFGVLFAKPIEFDLTANHFLL